MTDINPFTHKGLCVPIRMFANLLCAEYLEAVSAVDLLSLLVQFALVPVQFCVGVLLHFSDGKEVLGRETVTATGVQGRRKD